MDADPPLEHLLTDASGPGAGRDELEAIVARGWQRRSAMAAIGMIVMLAAGTVAGWAARSGRSPGRTSLAAGGPSATAVAHSGMAVPLPALVPRMTKRFVRATADGVTIRGYQSDPVSSSPVPCGGSSFFQAELSTTDVVGTAIGAARSSGAELLSDIMPMTIGISEKAPVWVVTVSTAPAVAGVRVTFPDGKTDQMTPVNGWATLAHVAPVPLTAPQPGNVTVVALDAGGRALATRSQASAIPMGPGDPVVPGTAPGHGPTVSPAPGPGPTVSPASGTGPTASPGPTVRGSSQSAAPLPTTTVLASQPPALPAITSPPMPVPCRVPGSAPAGPGPLSTVSSPATTASGSAK